MFGCNLSYTEIQNFLNKTDLTGLPKLRIVILRNIMLEPIEPYLKYLAYRIGFEAEIVFGEYDTIVQETMGSQGNLFAEQTDCVLIFYKLENLSWNLARNFNSLSSDQIEAEKNRIEETIENVLQGIRSKTDAMILWHGFELPIYPSYGIHDTQNANGQLSVLSGLNNLLRRQLSDTQTAYLVDLNLCIARIGTDNFYDPRYWHIGRAPYTRAALAEIAAENYKFIRAIKGKNKKCLVLDCDNTLWGGIIGEDGLSGIKLSQNYPGSAYYEFQQEIVSLYNRGIIIALCSKNNEDDVWDVFRNHPDMILKEKHIAAAQINWQDKAMNIKQIANDLNIGLDSMVFMDDSEFEANLIRELIPEVEVILLPKNKAVNYRDMLVSCGLLDNLSVSEEDKKRGAMYKAESKRKKAKVSYSNMEDYYASLWMEIEVSFADNFSIPRIAQLTQKTNQFNLTTRRYSEADIEKLHNSENSDVLYLKLSDKFGDSGVVGVVILKYENSTAIIDSFLLSCRVLGRGVEDVLVCQSLKLAEKNDAKKVIGEYYSTKKNMQVENFYSAHGFEEISSNGHPADRIFELDLKKNIKKEPKYFKLIKSNII